MTYPIRNGTILEGLETSFEKFFIFLKHFVLKNKCETALYQLSLDKNITSKLKQRFYNLIFYHNGEKAITIGGFNIIVEIDESFNVKRKYNRGVEILEIIIGRIESNTKERGEIFKLY